MADDTDNTTLKFVKDRADSVLKHEDLVDKQREKLAGMGVGPNDQTSVTREAAVLAALSARALIERQHLLATELSVWVNAMTASTTAAAKALSSTDVTTARLARCTKWLAVSTAALVLATAGLVVVEWLKSEPQIVIAPNPPTQRPVVITPMAPPDVRPTPARPTRKQ